MRLRTLLYTIILLTALLISFFIGTLTAGINHWFQPLVNMEISNYSGQTISTLKLSVKTAAVQHEIFFQPLENNKTIETQFFIQGEGGYQLEVTLENGQTVTGGSGYIEPGYTIKEMVRSNEISSKVSY
ncbi:hypothetical protein [Acinetobacter courvalinii]|uniref:Uncharacterized protein n=1 Tax=Acinetobacter courvalinii TaxID=280147 RepID=N9Q4W3_9GAMM|nr:hypothetical protein [Acinetobacter courvalinii]ENX40814.1 hypothetical protein F888_00294 [Acinetobacter courvalinii]KAB0661564.1 hypothetical protein F7P77_01490 [Acinetobacter courvalinii]RSN79772.1 hypothetical protein EA770_17700 [Acinetobacter baumannii]GGH45591.1 hypothetical protein GCM10007354_35410 [Acinetobacter courvalinii]